ncbi:MAG: class B sortase [Ruminococcaceae bacterium]|nr:class B sortase [Oscillospiraceae bacterium]
MKKKKTLITEEALINPKEANLSSTAPEKASPRPSKRFTMPRVNDKEGKRVLLVERVKAANTPKEDPKEKKRKDKKNRSLKAPKPSEKLLLNAIFNEEEEAPQEKEVKKQRSFGAIDYVRYLMLFICFSVFLYSSYTLVSSLLNRAESRELYDQLDNFWNSEDRFGSSYLKSSVQSAPAVDLLSAYVGVTPPEEDPLLKEDQNFSSIMAKINYLKTQNKDTVGWITVSGTNISYPVVHTTDNDYYLRRSFYGRSNLAGTLFVDYRNSKKLMENRNTVIYGHNMNDGSMFNNLHDFKNEDVFKNGIIEVATANGVFIYEVFSVHKPLDTSEYFQTDFENDEQFIAFLEEITVNSLYIKEGLELSPGDKVITLSTCVDPILQSEYRWAVHGKLIQVINYIP